MVTTNAAGQFIFEGLTPGQFTLEAGAMAHPAVTLHSPVSVPSLSGHYDIHLTQVH
jgi:hypothetical protein